VSTGRPPRIVSLLASATETVAALGALDRLVGRSHECDFPPEVRALPAVSEPAFPVDGSSAEIDARVSGRLADALSIYRIDARLLADLAPDVILTQDQCEVCAVSLADVEAALGAWLGRRPRVVSLRPNTLADAWTDIGRLAAAIGREREGAALVDRLRARTEAIAARAAGAARRPSLAAIEWIDPLMAAGNWMPELVRLAGGQPLFAEPGRHSPRLDWERLRLADPERILIAPCGFAIERSLEELAGLSGRPGWGDLAAVRLAQVAVADGNAYFNRPGPRLLGSLEILAEQLHPDLFDFGHRGRGWVRCPASAA
jgi:iron complex transport system substrate-binding protein